MLGYDQVSYHYTMLGIPIPSDQAVKIWRYMDLAKFVGLVDRGALFFSRADLLGDPFEGSVTQAELLAREMDLRSGNLRKDDMDRLRKRTLWARKWTYLSCWHLSAYESAAMWKLYGASNSALAIQSTFENLNRALPEDCYLGIVTYVDYLFGSIMSASHPIRPYYFKRGSFVHEQEVRAAIQDPRVEHKDPDFESEGEPGKYVSVDINDLVEAIYVAPTAPGWFRDVVVALAKRYDLKAPVRQSDLDSEPLF